MSHGKPHTKETRKKISEAIKKKYAENPEYRRKMAESQIGRTVSKETGDKISRANKGKKHSEEWCKKIGDSHRGKKLPPMSEESKKKISKTLMGHTPWNKGKKGVQVSSRRGIHLSEEMKKRISQSLTGRIQSAETLRKRSVALRGEKHYNWQGGISRLPYCWKFSPEFKERVRAFFHYQCTECGTPQNGKRLHVHHVNFNKMSCCDNIPPLFVALCNHCHGITQKNREYWEQHFTEIIEGYYQGQCYLSASVISHG